MVEVRRDRLRRIILLLEANYATLADCSEKALFVFCDGSGIQPIIEPTTKMMPFYIIPHLSVQDARLWSQNSQQTCQIEAGFCCFSGQLQSEEPELSVGSPRFESVGKDWDWMGWNPVEKCQP